MSTIYHLLSGFSLSIILILKCLPPWCNVISSLHMKKIFFYRNLVCFCGNPLHLQVRGLKFEPKYYCHIPKQNVFVYHMASVYSICTLFKNLIRYKKNYEKIDCIVYRQVGIASSIHVFSFLLFLLTREQVGTIFYI